jgi:RHS repeat-associated protein
MRISMPCEAPMAARPPFAVWIVLVALWAAMTVAGSTSTAQAAGSSGSGLMGPSSVPTSTLISSSDGGLVGSDFSSQLDFSPEAACDPRIQSCKPPDGGGAGGSNGDCPKWKQDLGLCKPGDGGGGTCGPGPGGPPDECSTGPTNSPGGAGGSVNVGGGNPVNLITGNKYQTEIDLPALPGVLGLELTRHFNAMGRYNGLTGSGWRTSYEAVLYDFGALIQITQADGRRITFDRVADSGNAAHGTLCTASQPTDGQVTIHQRADGKNEYRWRWTDGRVLTFSDGSGGGYPLQSIRAASGETLSLTYAPKGELVRVRDPQGRSLDFVYDRQVRLQAIVTPVSRIDYTIDASGRLTQVAIKPRQDGPAAQARPNTRRYHYEDRYNAGWKNVLTGISAVVFDDKGQASEQRLSTYAYDAQGRAILSTKGRPRELVKGQQTAGTGIEQIDLKYQDITAPAEIARLSTGMKEARPRLLSRTTLTNATGQTTEILSAVIGGHYRLLSMKGPGCSTCGPSNRAYSYDAAGRLLRTTRLDAQGEPTASRYQHHDPHGRLTEEGVQAANAPAQWQVRYRYRDIRFKDGSIALGQQPIVIARPSGVPGRQTLTRLEYNDRGQVLKATDEAWSPVDVNGQETPAGSPIRRTTAFTYTPIEGSSVLTRIDGPLPNGPSNGPKDSDITELRWDTHARQITAIVYPLGETASVEADEASGWLRKVTGRSGLTDELGYDLFGQIVQRTSHHNGEPVDGQRWQRDASGRVIETARLMIGNDTPAWLPQTRMQYDVAGRLQWQAQFRGSLSAAVYDAEGRLLSSTVTGAGMQQQERYGYDDAGRLQRVSDSTGAVRELARDADGRIEATLDPLGRATTAQAGTITDAANTTQALNVSRSASGVRIQGADGRGGQRQSETRILRDDFGQVVLEQSDDAGLELRRYDEAGRLIRRSDANGHITELGYDVAGRLIRKIVGAKAGKPQTTQYRYEGQQLTQIDNPVQSERFGFDAQGRVTQRTVSLNAEDGKAITTATTTYRYTTDGTLVAQGLPDGSELQYERDGFGQIRALHRQPLPALETSWATRWIAGWTRQTLAIKLQRDLTGLSHLTYGNGIEGQWQRSAEGVLARVVYRRTGTPQASSGLRAWIEQTMPSARAQAAAPAASAAASAPVAPAAPGAIAEPEDASALWDSRLLYDSAGNLIVVRDSGAVVNSQARWSHYSYDGLNQLIQAWQTTKPANVTLAQSVNDPDTNLAKIWRYHHDSLGHRLLMQEPADTEATPLRKVSIDAPAGDAAAKTQAVPAHGAGLPAADAVHPDRQWRWNADGTLRAVLQDGKELARYAYNHEGLRVMKQSAQQAAEYTLYDEQRHRVADIDAQGRITRQYVWMGDRLLAMLDAQKPWAPQSDQATGIFATIAAAWRHLTSEHPRVSYVHTNHLGAPIAVTDGNAATIWQAQYTPYGQRVGDRDVAQTAKAIQLDLRLPGQWADAETGLHYNDQRYYDPQLGRYISADPLGLQGGLNRYAYVGNNPMGFTDPLGLVLFAFDGTGNTNVQTDLGSEDSVSNVWRFYQAYNSGNRRYITGVGMRHRDAKYGDIVPDTYASRTRLDLISGDMPLNLVDQGGNYSGPARISRMRQYFNDEADAIADDEVMEVDIVGFSRGSAQARDFANRVIASTRNGAYTYFDQNREMKCQKVNFRFMGLFDTVLSTNWSGIGYGLGISSAFAHVAQAVALNEYRSDSLSVYKTRVPLDWDQHWGGFPLESIGSTAGAAGKVRVEKGFIGAHADIGGGYADYGLSLVALNWMVRQARDAGIQTLPVQAIPAQNPVIHDKSNAIQAGNPNNRFSLRTGRSISTYSVEDRDVRRSGSGSTQRTMGFADGGMTNADTHQFIEYRKRDSMAPSNSPLNPLNFGQVTGTVDINGYRAWLQSHGYQF